MTAHVELEYLGTPGREPRRLPRTALAVVALLALLVAGGLWWSDHVRSTSVEELSMAFADADQEATAGEAQVQGTLAYASPMIWSTAVGEDVRAGLRQLVQDSAAEVADRLDVIRQRVAGTTVLPWHQEQLRARAALLTLIDAQEQRFRGIAADARDIDMILADGPLPTGAAARALEAAGAR